MSGRIHHFRFQWAFLSNFYPSPITWEGIDYPTVEHAYQAAKTLNILLRAEIAALSTPGKAKRAGQRLKLREDWEEIRIDVMRQLLWMKFSNPELRRLLLDTGNRELTEENYWGDQFWGVYNGVGENNLGRLLMEIRNDIRLCSTCKEPKENPYGLCGSCGRFPSTRWFSLNTEV